MELFSQRKGFKPSKIMQINSMDSDLRNSLWNCFYSNYLTDIPLAEQKLGGYMLLRTDLENRATNALYIAEIIWKDYFKRPIDEFRIKSISNNIKDCFLNCEWYEVYSLLEFVANYYLDKDVNQNFIQECNFILEREMSGYRFVSGQITEITSEEEINEIEESIKEAPNPVSIHLNKSLELLSDRKSPDYRNSIKESISAIESICKLITKKPKGTLGKCLNTIENDMELHPALKEAFKKLYGYTSDAEGIRHALMADESKLDFEDAKFMLVSCSAFTNYLMAKAAKSDIEL